MIQVIIQTIQLLGRRVLIKISSLSGALIFSGLFQIIPLMLIMPLIRVIARPNKQSDGLPKRMKRLLPEDLANYLDNLIATTETTILIASVALAALILFGTQALMTRYIKKYTTNFVNKQSAILANKLFNNYLEADIFSYTNPISKIDSGCGALAEILNSSILTFFNISMFFLLAFILIYIYPLSGVASVAVIVTSISLFAFIIQPKMNLLINQANLDIAKGSRALGDSMSAIKEIKLMGRERFFFDRYLQSQVQKQGQQELKDRFEGMSNIIQMIMRYLGLAVGLGLAVYSMPKEELAGFVMIFMLLASRVTGHAQQIISESSKVYQKLLVLELHYKTLLKYHKPQSNFTDDTIVCEEDIEFKNIYFRHENTKDDDDEDYEAVALVQQEEKEEKKELPLILEDINLRIKQGQFIGLVGKNGSGKSTILDLSAGLLIPTQGNILIDGKELGISDRRNWRRQINYVIQRSHIISETILYNVTLGLEEEEIDKKRLNRALELSMLNQVIEQLPEGLDTQVGIKGTKISGGQAQRIVLARAIYQDRPVLFLDEATRAIDAATEAEIMEKISVMRGKKTLIIVTHRVQSLKQCDKIYVLDDKKIVAEGDYETLCETSELFRLFALGEKQTKEREKENIPSVA